VTVTAPPVAGITSRIAAVGDIACDPSSASFNGGNGTGVLCQQKATSDLVVNGGYEAFLGLGDQQYENGTFDAFMASYDLSWGRVKSITKPVPGNHEYDTANAAGYYQYFGSAAGDPAKGYYSYNIGEWHVVALNSNCGVVSCAQGSAQETWLRADLAANPTRCALVYWHHPLYSSGQRGGNPDLRALYQAAYDGGVDVALAGHEHQYERFAPQDALGNLDAARGIRQFVVGTGGKSFYPIGTVRPNSERRITDTHGILEMTLQPDRYTWNFVPEAGRTVTDAGIQACN